jgi:hypothetical protein
MCTYITSENCVDKFDLIKDVGDTTCYGCRGRLGAKTVSTSAGARYHLPCFQCRACDTSLVAKKERQVERVLL